MAQSNLTNNLLSLAFFSTALTVAPNIAHSQTAQTPEIAGLDRAGQVLQEAATAAMPVLGGIGGAGVLGTAIWGLNKWRNGREKKHDRTFTP